MGEEGHKAQARAADGASGGGGCSIEAREKFLDREGHGLDDGRLAPRGLVDDALPAAAGKAHKGERRC